MKTINERLADAYSEVISDSSITKEDVYQELKKSHRYTVEMMKWLEAVTYRLNEMKVNDLLRIRDITKKVEELAKSMKIE